MNWNTKSKMIKLMQAKKKGRSVETSLIFGLQFIDKLPCTSVYERDMFPKRTQDQCLGSMNTHQLLLFLNRDFGFSSSPL